MQDPKKLFLVLLTILTLVGLFIISQNIPQEEVQSYLEGFGAFAPIVFILIMLISFIIPPISGVPLLFAGFFAFGNNVVFLVTTAALISFIINFWVARKLGRPFVERLIGKHSLEYIDKTAKDWGIALLFILRVFQGGGQDFISYAAGISNMQFKTYLLVSITGVIPGTIIWYFVSLQAETPTQFTAISIAFAIFFTFIFVFGGQLYRNWKGKS